MEAIGRLAGGIAHDFNNLLTAVIGYSNLLMQDIAQDDAQHERVAQIAHAADRAAALTRQLLTFSRKQVLDVKVLNLNVVIQGMEEMIRRLIVRMYIGDALIVHPWGLSRRDPAR